MKDRLYLVSPLFDILFVCGGAPWLLGITAYLTIGTNISGDLFNREILSMLTVIYVAASILIGESHQFTSILRYYGTFKERSKRYKLSRLPLWIIYFTLIMLMLMQTAAFRDSQVTALFSQFGLFEVLVVLDFLISLFPFFLAQHFCGQSQAIGVIYCRMRGFNLTRDESLLLTVTSWFLVFAGATTIAKPFGSMLFSSVMIGFLFFESLWKVLALLLCLATTCYFLRRGFVKEEWLPRESVLTWASLALFFLLPSPFMIFVWLFVPLLFHATQHWAVAWHVRQEEKDREGLMRPEGGYAMLDFMRMMLPIQLATVSLLFFPLWLTIFNTGLNSESLGSSITLGVHLSMLVFYIHYFSDRMVWRSRH